MQTMKPFPQAVHHRPISLLCAGAAAFFAAASAGVGAAHAQTGRVSPDGRPVLPVPVSPNVTQIAAEGNFDGVVYEPQRIKRTVSLKPEDGLASWDVLYSVEGSPSGGGVRTAYFDWDNDFLYFALETASPVRDVRFDIDLANDGWLKGADNLAIFVTPPAEGAQTAPKVVVQRFDMVQNKNAPVWAASPIPEAEIKVRAAKTPFGTYTVTVALPRTETLGVFRKPGTEIGVRMDAGNLTPYQNEAVLIPVRPLLRLKLDDSIPAADGSVKVSVEVAKREILPQGELKASIEVRNEGTAPVRLSRLFLRGAGGESGKLLDDQKFAGVEIGPGKSVRRELKSNVPPGAPIGTFVLAGGADIDGTGKTLTALTSFDEIEPYIVTAEADDKPVPSGTIAGEQTVREVKVVVKSRANLRTPAQVKLILPTGWTIDKEAPSETTLTLAYVNEIRTATFRVVVPPRAEPGRYKIAASVKIGERTYSASDSILVLR